MDDPDPPDIVPETQMHDGNQVTGTLDVNGDDQKANDVPMETTSQ